jgi:hypothetical protein
MESLKVEEGQETAVAKAAERKSRRGTHAGTRTLRHQVGVLVRRLGDGQQN